MLKLLIFYGSYRRDRVGIRFAHFVQQGLAARGHDVDLIDARSVDLPMLDRMFKEYPVGEAPPAMAELAAKIRGADGFVFVIGEYNWGMQPGLKNLTDHFLEEWFWRPAAIVSYSPGQVGGARAAMAWHPTLSEMGMVVISSTLVLGHVGEALDADGRPQGKGGDVLEQRFPRFAADLEWWASAAANQRALQAPPY